MCLKCQDEKKRHNSFSTIIKRESVSLRDGKDLLKSEILDQINQMRVNLKPIVKINGFVAASASALMCFNCFVLVYRAEA